MYRLQNTTQTLCIEIIWLFLQFVISFEIFINVKHGYKLVKLIYLSIYCSLLYIIKTETYFITMINLLRLRPSYVYYFVTSLIFNIY